MTPASAVAVLLLVTFITFPTANHAHQCTGDRCNGVQPDWKLLGDKNRTAARSQPDGPSLSCYDCSAHNPECGVNPATLVHGCQSCMIYRNTYDANTIVRRCCSSGCGAPGTIGEFDGRQTYFCASNECNGAGAEKALPAEPEEKTTTGMSTTGTSPTMMSTTTAAVTTRGPSSCYECSGTSEHPCKETALNCPMCMVHRNDNDPTKFDRRCCWWACGAPNQVSEYNGRPTYFCSGDHCNGAGSEAILGYVTTTTIATTTVAMTTVTTESPVSECFDCSGPDCGREGSTMSNNCPKCMVYRNPDDQTKIERRCCWWGCGPSNSVSTYNGIPTYFCTGNKCNGYGTEYALGPPITTTTMRTTTIATSWTTPTTTTTTESPSSQCFDCSGPDCGREGSTMSMNCPKCMVYRNPDDQTKIERRCCWWGCGPSNTVSTYNGMPTYFCTGNKCNGYGTEYALGPPVTTTTQRTSSSFITTTTTIYTTTTTPEPFASQCFDCSGPNCGKEGSTTANNCPKCMVHRNPTDQTIIERRCCWWGCGPSNSVSTYNGMETYFCTGNKCNGYGTEYALSPPVTTTTVTTVTASSTATNPSMTMTPSTSGTCSLRCQNGGTPETEDGCFCYCIENTSGRECENVNCAQPDIDPEVCSWENRALCEESESFAFECLHLCGKC